MGGLLRPENWPVGWPLTALVVAAALNHAGARLEARPSWRRVAVFDAGLFVLFLAVDSPIDAYADRLFVAHMTQHVVLTMVAPPLLLLGRPWPRLIKPFPAETRRSVLARIYSVEPLRRAVEWIARPLPAFVAFNATLLAWHIPALYDATLRSTAVHDFEHAMLFGTALLFWRHLVHPGRGRALSDAGRVAYAGGAILASWALALVLALAPEPLYAAYAQLAHRPLGLSALGDQQLAAGVMWVPASIPYTIAMFAAAYRFLDPTSGRARRAADLRPRET
jgi:cytochrome c oxidase assembly factor CtaG